ncbi:unnamed protein product [Lathyrus sativus]|nr:unnamed protein product [Lathyrus sativus]
MLSGLRINFWKSNRFRIGCETDFLVGIASFLSCRVGSFPFRFLGLDIGVNLPIHDFSFFKSPRKMLIRKAYPIFLGIRSVVIESEEGWASRTLTNLTMLYSPNGYGDAFLSLMRSGEASWKFFMVSLIPEYFSRIS